MENNIDMLDKNRSLAWSNAQTWQHAIAVDSNDFVTELRVVSFDLLEKLRKMTMRILIKIIAKIFKYSIIERLLWT